MVAIGGLARPDHRGQPQGVDPRRHVPVDVQAKARALGTRRAGASQRRGNLAQSPRGAVASAQDDQRARFRGVGSLSQCARSDSAEAARQLLCGRSRRLEARLVSAFRGCVPWLLECSVVSAEEVDEYLSAVDEPKRSTLEALRRTILEIVPDAEQVISYRVPAFRVRGKVIAGFAAFKDHLSYLSFSGSVLGQLADELQGYAMTKSALHFPVDRPPPTTLVKRLITLRLAEIGEDSR